MYITKLKKKENMGFNNNRGLIIQDSIVEHSSILGRMPSKLLF